MYLTFALHRLIEVKLTDDPSIREHEKLTNDREWLRYINLKLKPHPENWTGDHTLKEEAIEIKVRSAMAGYFLRLWNIDCSIDKSIKDARFQYFLSNLDNLSKDKDLDLKLAPGFENIS